MAEGAPTLEYHLTTGAGIRWGRIIAASCILLLVPVTTAVTQLGVLLLNLAGPSGNMMPYYLVQSTIPGVISPTLMLAGGLLLVASHHPRPHGEGLSVGRTVAAGILALYWLVTVAQVSALTWRYVQINAGAIPGTGFQVIAQILYWIVTALWLALVASICLYMYRVSTLSRRSSFLVLTLIFAALAILLRIAGITFNFLILPRASISTVQFISPIMTILGILLYLIYWPMIAVFAWSASRAARAIAR
jgi:hypothetical protein